MDTKSILAGSALIVALSVGYYFGFYLPQNEAKQQLLKNQSACFDMEQKVVDQYITENIGTPIKRNEVSTQNHFNLERNKCIVQLTWLPSCSGNVCMMYTTVYDASEFRGLVWAMEEVAAPNSSRNYYEDDSTVGTSTVLTQQKYDELVSNYMSK